MEMDAMLQTALPDGVLEKEKEIDRLKQFVEELRDQVQEHEKDKASLIGQRDEAMEQRRSEMEERRKEVLALKEDFRREKEAEMEEAEKEKMQDELRVEGKEGVVLMMFVMLKTTTRGGGIFFFPRSCFPSLIVI